MEFFNCSKKVTINDVFEDDGQNVIKNISTAELLTDKNIYDFIKRLDNLFFSNHKYALSDISFATKYTINEIAYKNPIYCGIVGDYSNHFAGSYDTFDDVSNFGKWAIRQLTNNKIMIDLRNMSEKSFMTTMSESQFTCIVTNAGLSGLYGKNVLRPYQEKMLVETGSLICLSLNKNGIKLIDIAESVADFVEKYGTKNLCVSNERLKNKTFQKALELFTIYLSSYGLSKQEIEDIIFNNMNRFIQKNYIDMTLIKNAL